MFRPAIPPALGFTAFQAGQNVTYKRGKNWTDGAKVKLHHKK